MQTLRAHYDHGKLEFEKPPKIEKAEVLVTFLEEKPKSSRNDSFPKVDMDKLKKKKSVLDGLDGILEGVDISNWKEERLKYLQEKYK